MRKIKPEFTDAKERRDVIVLQNAPHQGLVKANRFLLLIAATLMIVIFVLGFLLMPEENMLDSIKTKRSNPSSNIYEIQNPVLSDEINILKGQLVGLISGSIESKLRALETSVRTGSTTDSLGTIQDLKNDVKVLQAYSTPEKNNRVNQGNHALLQEVSHLKRLFYLTLASCALMFVAIAGFLVRKHFHLSHHNPKKIVILGREK